MSCLVSAALSRSRSAAKTRRVDSTTVVGVVLAFPSCTCTSEVMFNPILWLFSFSSKIYFTVSLPANPTPPCFHMLASNKDSTGGCCLRYRYISRILRRTWCSDSLCKFLLFLCIENRKVPHLLMQRRSSFLKDNFKITWMAWKMWNRRFILMTEK